MNKILELNSSQLKEIVGGDAPFDTTFIPATSKTGQVPMEARNQPYPGSIGAQGQFLHDFVKGI
jgi:hypothetical protein